jgi:hypothetical protein
MKLENVREAYETLSSKASEIVRQLSLAGIALVWLFKSGTPEAPVIEKQLVRAALLIILALFCDLLQYLVGTAVWAIYFRHKEDRGTAETDDFTASPYLNWPTWGLFCLKSAMMLLAYVLYIIPFLVSRFGRL